MSRNCQICDRGTTSGQQKSHAQNKSKRQVKINLQTKTVDGKKQKICTKCIKNLRK